ncbi:glycosyltransferase family 4 protein [Brevundimonas sp. 2R-24]|uniref:Glycosyltransferase family 4 protein n=1 Tax=Peiella sedimenti TaxID=3061083 RepID=A0ABT8SKC2_9CAUL|nr:glycosyltransferase family 4 protein [Caulobacteraceae bacterium XZ-24]
MVKRQPPQADPDLQARYDALAEAHVRLSSQVERQRERFGVVLAQLSNAERLEGLRSPRPGPGRWIGGLVDLAVYGAAYLIGWRRPVSRTRALAGLRGDLPGLYDLIQKLRGRPSLAHRDGRLETIRFQGVSAAPGAPVLELRNLFAHPRTRSAVSRACKTLLAAGVERGPIRHVVALNFYGGGGAERTALAYARALADEGGHAAVILTDPGPRRVLPVLPEGVTALDFEALDADLDAEERQTLLFLLLQALAPETLHIVNCDAAWRMLLAVPRPLLPVKSVVASAYALQEDPKTGAPIGYSALMVRAGDKVDRLITDNRVFAEQVLPGIGFDPDRISAVHNACRLEDAVDQADAQARLERRIAGLGEAGRITVVWAGRLDLEKRVDLLHEVARLGADRFDFRIYGAEVMDRSDWGRRLADLPNVRVMGPYASPLAWDEDGAAQLFLFTSSIEGLPNTLVEAGWLGFPVVATDVGGVGDLIDPVTGWPLPPEAEASDYLAALNEAATASGDTRRRAAALIERTHSRHSLAAFEQALAVAYPRAE